MNSANPERVKFGPFEADLHTHELWKFGTKIKLVGQPFEVLAILLSKPGQLVTREELREKLWPGDTFVDFDHGLNAAVNRLREALSDSVDSPRYVETLPRRGYRFIQPVERKGEERKPLEPQPQITSPEVARVATEPNEFIPTRTIPAAAVAVAAKPTKPSRRIYYWAAGILLFALIGAHFFMGRSPAEISVAYTPAQRIRPLVTVPGETGEPAFSADGNYVAFRRNGGKPENSGIFVKAIDSDQLVQVTKNDDDCCPVWSPDGTQIAFSRARDRQFSIFVVAAPHARTKELSANGQPMTVVLDGAERKLNTEGVNPKHGQLAWSPDGKFIAFSDGNSIFTLSMSDSTVKRVSMCPPLSEDWGPVYSQDGKNIMFVRSRTPGFPEEIMTVSASGGEAARLFSEHARILGPPQWAPDGESLIFGSDRGGRPGLWRVSMERGDQAVQFNDNGWYPAVSPKGYRLAYQRITRSLSVWEKDVSTPGIEQKIVIPSTSESDQGPGPQISPDGTKLAYMSDHAGSMEIWVSNRDGSNAYQLTAIGSAGTPRWSPDSKSIAFDGSNKNHPSVFVVDLQGRQPRMISGEEMGQCPSWSADGKWIYYASNRDHVEQVWKVPVDGGPAVQVTTGGGHAALASPDGRYIYYAKSYYANPEIWQVPVNGGQEKIVSSQLRPYTWASWDVTQEGIVFAGPSPTGEPMIGLYNPSTHVVTKLGSTETVPFWLGASRDGKSVVFDQPGWQLSQVMLAENFR